MKKYKLLKEIPGCKVGDILYVNEEDGEGSFVHTAVVGTGYVLPIKVLEDYKEYFEEIFEWPKSWEDVQDCTLWSWANNQLLFINPNHPLYKSIVARLKLEEIAKEMNGDWVPDWSDSDMFKYTIVSNSKRLKITYNWRDPKLLVFKIKEMAEFSLEHHRKLWEDYWMINK